MLQMRQTGTLEQKYVYFLLAMSSAKDLFPFSPQVARRLRLVPIPSHLRGLANVEEVVAAAKESEEELEVEKAARKSPLMQLQMIIEFDESSGCIFLLPWGTGKRGRGGVAAKHSEQREESACSCR